MNDLIADTDTAICPVTRSGTKIWLFYTEPARVAWTTDVNGAHFFAGLL